MRHMSRLKVGFTGHRLNQLEPAQLPQVQYTIEETFRALRSVGIAAGTLRRPMLAVGLAEGADRIAAYVALNNKCVMQAVIPYSIPRYLRDFTSEVSCSEFERLLSLAVSKTYIDGETIDRLRGEFMGYAAAGSEIATHCDVLLAVWNGKPPKGPGGTAEVCALALSKGAPVLWIDADGNGPQLIFPQARAPKVGSFRARLFAALKARFPETAQPADMRVAEKPAAS
jgi:hypothetical protein